MPVNLTAYVVTCALLAMLPGAGQALMLRQTLTLGPRAAWATIAGTCTGLLVWSVAAAGLSAVLLANPTAFAVLRAAGGVVLVALGISSLRTMLRLRRAMEPDPPAPARRAYLAGLGVNLGNPKAGVFALAFIPQFIAPPGPVFATAVLLGLLWALTTAAWYVVFVAAVDRGRSIVSRPAVRTGLHALTGVVLIALGAGVALGA